MTASPDPSPAGYPPQSGGPTDGALGCHIDPASLPPGTDPDRGLCGDCEQDAELDRLRTLLAEALDGWARREEWL